MKKVFEVGRDAISTRAEDREKTWRPVESLTSGGTEPGVAVGGGGARVALRLPGRAGGHARVLPVLGGRLQAAFKVGVSAHRGRGSGSVRLTEPQRQRRLWVSQPPRPGNTGRVTEHRPPS